ncbi:hypothetical protein Tco_1493487 [Tanacetum coccineum]
MDIFRKISNCDGFDTQPHMLDRTDFAYMVKQIRLYCQGKENGVNILKSFDEGPFQMGTFRETLAEGNEGNKHPTFRCLLPKIHTLLSIIHDAIRTYRQRRDYSDYYVRFSNSSMTMRKQSDDHVLRMQLNSKFVDKHVRQNRVLVIGGALDRVGSANTGQAGSLDNGVALDEEQLLFIAGGQDNAIDEDVDEQPVQDLALNVDNVFQADDCDAFDYDVDEAPIAQTMFMANLSFADPVYDKAGLSYDSDVLSEVYDNDHYQDVVCEHHEIHERHEDVQPNYVVDSHADYTSDSNMILYDQYIKDNTVPVVQNNVSSCTK